MKIIDCHGHIFPPLAGACGFETGALHRLHQQYAMHTHGNQPVRRARDHMAVTDKHLWSHNDSSEAGRVGGLNFRADGNGRFAWDYSGESFYIQFLSPSLQNMEATADSMVAHMDYAGIDRVVLQNDHIYGNLAEYFNQASTRYPGRFIGLAQVEEGFADRDSETARLIAQVQDNGMHGLYFTLAGFFRSGWKTHYTDTAFKSFWNTVRSLSIPVFWVFPGHTPWGSFINEMERFALWLEAYPDIPSVIVHGWPTGVFAADNGRIAWPDIICRIQEDFPVYSEILYPIGWGGRHEYPYRAALDHVRQIYERFGPAGMIWGSDMPNVERYCSYRQSLAYLGECCDYMSDADRKMVFADNTLSLFRKPAAQWAQ